MPGRSWVALIEMLRCGELERSGSLGSFAILVRAMLGISLWRITLGFGMMVVCSSKTCHDFSLRTSCFQRDGDRNCIIFSTDCLDIARTARKEFLVSCQSQATSKLL